MEDYETKMFLAEAKNITLGDMLDIWVEEDLKPGSLSNGTVMAYQSTVSRIKQHPIGKRKLKTVTSATPWRMFSSRRSGSRLGIV